MTLKTKDKNNIERLVVPIDVSKYFHMASVVGPKGDVLEEPFEIDIYKEGFEKLLNKLKMAQEKTRIKQWRIT